MTGLKWSSAEKKIARRAFDAALNRERTAMMAMLKKLAASASKPEDIWAIDDYLFSRALDGQINMAWNFHAILFS
jgi:hypothetical protein